MARILTITLNPALDLNLETGPVTLGSVNRSQATRLDPAGKGINLGQVLARLGHDVTVSGLLGETNAAPFERLFASAVLKDRFIRVPGQNRTNVKIAETGGRVTDFNGPGFTAPDDAVSRLDARLEEMLGQVDAVVIGGSLPGQLAPGALATLIRRVRAADIPVWIDTSGAALNAGLEAKPDGVKPNLDELAEWAGQALDTPEAVARSARALQETGIANVVVSMGEQGVLWLSPTDHWRALPPPVAVVSTVCAGDTLLAGMLHGLVEGHQPDQVLATATALSAECVRHIGVGDPRVGDFTQLIEQTRVTALTPWPGHNNNGEMPL